MNLYDFVMVLSGIAIIFGMVLGFIDILYGTVLSCIGIFVFSLALVLSFGVKT